MKGNIVCPCGGKAFTLVGKVIHNDVMKAVMEAPVSIVTATCTECGRAHRYYLHSHRRVQ